MIMELIKQDVRKRPKLKRDLELLVWKTKIQSFLHKVPFVLLAAGFLAALGVSGSGLASHSLWAKSNSIELPSENELEQLLLTFSLDPQEKEEPFQTPKVDQFPELVVKTYRIRPGETLSEVAQKNGIRLDTLISMNEISNARKVPAGSNLLIPNTNGIIYKVSRGDSLSKIATMFKVNVQQLADANDLVSSVIHPGMKLFIPGAMLPQTELKRILGELFIFPTTGRITSSFGIRPDPFTGVRRFHNGIDIAHAPGTSIHAALAGKVARIGFHPSYGKYVIITHDGGLQTFYAHLQTIAVPMGKTVAQGSIIGEMGSTGYSTGSHLHFSVFKNGNPIDPMQYFK
ncbi:MAG: M23 family metallopeptidase [Spirochaetales bacterium]|nr:M23 family metallopeptidase [Spirochaetales bacterium]